MAIGDRFSAPVVRAVREGQAAEAQRPHVTTRQRFQIRRVVFCAEKLHALVADCRLAQIGEVQPSPQLALADVQLMQPGIRFGRAFRVVR